MVDFKNVIKKKVIEKKINPIELYDTLDRASDKGPLRPIQVDILKNWFEQYHNKKDVIIKLHTGQGKTLIGLLILQSRINQMKGPAIYACPNNYLIKQTCEQASQFGFEFVTIEGNYLPEEFLESKKILITSIQKIFTGLGNKFGIGNKSMDVGSIVIDDAHSCIDAIRSSTSIKINFDEPAYKELFNLFAEDLENQGLGTFYEIKDHKIFDSFLPVPYWSWSDKQNEVTKIISKNLERDSVKYSWPVLKDMLKDCMCLFSGSCLEITPYLPPIHMYGSFYNANHRVFMSATINDDSFFIKGLGISKEVVNNPLVYNNEKWSGEKMILIPSLISDEIDRDTIANYFSKMSQKKYGIVVITPGARKASIWKDCGAIITKTENIEQELNNYKQKSFEKTIVILNRYEGIDLPDDMCRILILDSKPYSETLLDKYQESCRKNSVIIAIKIAQKIEQGLGRSVRGEKDYSVILVIGSELVQTIRSPDSKKYFSTQTKTQIEIGLEIAKFAKDDINSGTLPKDSLFNLIKQCLSRDEGWKEFYKERMDSVETEKKNSPIAEILEYERKAEIHCLNGEFTEARQTIQDLIDKKNIDSSDVGWYLQEMARFIYSISKSESNQMQINAHKVNKYLLKPRDGMVVTKLENIGQQRTQNLIQFLKEFDSYDSLKVFLDSIISDLSFGVKADKFESAMNDLAKFLGFDSQRPDKEWKAGPDNLWYLRDNDYIIFECKSEVADDRDEIYKSESEQMNSASIWFEKNYGRRNLKRILIIPTRKVSKSGGFSDEVQIMRKNRLKLLKEKVRSFYNELSKYDLKDLNELKLTELLEFHNLSVEKIKNDYSEQPYFEK